MLITCRLLDKGDRGADTTDIKLSLCKQNLYKKEAEFASKGRFHCLFDGFESALRPEEGYLRLLWNFVADNQ